MTTQPTLEQIVTRYLYNSDETPTDLLDPNLLRPADAIGEPFAFDLNWYMTTGPGRFAFGSLSPIVKEFFRQETNTETGEKEYVHHVEPGVLL